MKNHERYSTVPHIDLIVEDGSITIPSIFMFGKDATGLFLFINCCRENNCIVTFENESLTIDPKEEVRNTNMVLQGYMSILSMPKIAEDYIKYLFHSKEMSWDDVKKEG